MKKEVEKTVIDIDITKTWLYQEGKQEGLEEGREEGIREGLKEALLSVLEVKFGKISKSIKKEIMRIDNVDKLRFLKREAMKAKTLKEFEKKLRTIDYT